MFTTSKIKWFVSIILAGILLVLTIFGGKWGTNYTASASVNAAPVIYYIDPSIARVGSPDTLVEILGSNFGTEDDTRVRLTGGGFDVLFVPEEIAPGRIVITIPAGMLVDPIVYTLTVIKSKYGTIPTIPTIPNPPDDEISNPVPFTVFETLPMYLPIINKI
jgi:hypothetical protein